MCVGALLESDVEALVYAVPNSRDGAAGTVVQLAQHASLPRRIKVVSGIRRDEVEALFVRQPDRLAGRRQARQGRRRAAVEGSFGILSRGEVSEWLMVPLSKSGVRKHRGFESRPLRHHTRSHGPVETSGRWRRGAPPLASVRLRWHPAYPARADSGRGRLVDYGAALEMRFGQPVAGSNPALSATPASLPDGRCPR